MGAGPLVREEFGVRTRSCDFDRLYAHGGWIDPPLAANDVLPAGQWVADIYPPYAYDRPLPEAILSDDADTIVKTYREWNATYHSGAATSLFAFEHAVIFDRTIYVPVDGEWIPVHETHRAFERSLKPLPFSPELLANARRAINPDAAFLYVGTVGSENYAHWLVDDLPRLRPRGLIKGPITVLIDRYFYEMDRARFDSLLAFAGKDTTVTFLDKSACYFFDRLYYVTPPTYHPFLKSPEAVQAVASLARRGAGPTRLFVARNALWRNLLNVEEVGTPLKALGFTAVITEGSTFEEQRALFADAEIIVGVSGASMGNTIFTPRGIPVVYLAGEGFTDPFYWDLASIKEQRYFACFGDLEHRAQPTFSSFRLSRDRVAALIDLVRSLL